MGKQYQEVVHRHKGQVVEVLVQGQMQPSRRHRREGEVHEGGLEEGVEGAEPAQELGLLIYNVCLLFLSTIPSPSLTLCQHSYLTDPF